jgi:hypothetical protein
MRVKKSISIYLVNGTTIVLHGNRRHEIGYFSAIRPIEILSYDVDEEIIGNAMFKLLNMSSGNFLEEGELAKFAGFKSENEFTKCAKHCSVSQLVDAYTFTASKRNKKAFEYILDGRIEAPLTITPIEMGAYLKQVFTFCV